MPQPSQVAASPLAAQDNFLRVAVALFLAGFATFSLLYCTQPLLPEFAAEFGLSPAASSLALSVSTASLAFSIMIVAAVSEALGRRGLMFGSMCLAATLNFAAAFAPDWHLLLLARAIEGFVLGGVPAVAMAYLAEEIPPNRLGLAMGIYVGGTAFGGMIGRVAIGVLTAWTDWRTAMATMAVADVLMAIGFVLLLPPSRNFVRRAGLGARFHFSAWAAHLRRSEMTALFLVAFLSMGAFVTVYNYVGFRLLAPPYALSQAQIGLIFLAYVCGIGASSAGGALADRFGRGRVALAGAGLNLLGLLLSLAQPLWLLIGGIALITAGFFALHSAASAWVGLLAAGNKGHASSLYLLAYYLGSSLIGSLGGWFWHAGRWPAIVGFEVVLLLVAAALLRLPARSQVIRR